LKSLVQAWPNCGPWVFFFVVKQRKLITIANYISFHYLKKNKNAAQIHLIQWKWPVTERDWPPLILCMVHKDWDTKHIVIVWLIDPVFTRSVS
jgi:hypothetical protein